MFGGQDADDPHYVDDLHIQLEWWPDLDDALPSEDEESGELASITELADFVNYVNMNMPG